MDAGARDQSGFGNSTGHLVADKHLVGMLLELAEDESGRAAEEWNHLEMNLGLIHLERILGLIHRYLALGLAEAGDLEWLLPGSPRCKDNRTLQNPKNILLHSPVFFRNLNKNLLFSQYLRQRVFDQPVKAIIRNM